MDAYVKPLANSILLSSFISSSNALFLIAGGLSYMEYTMNINYITKVQTMINPALMLIRPLTFFTCSGHYLSCLYILWPLIFNEPAPAPFAGLCFGVLVGITIGFWIFVYDGAAYAPLDVRRKRKACDDSLRLTMEFWWTTGKRDRRAKNERSEARPVKTRCSLALCR